jgi:hypothetical protein
MRGTQKNALEALNDELIPVLKTELRAADTAGVLKPRLEGQATRFANAAESKVEDVRRFGAPVPSHYSNPPAGAGVRAAEKAAATNVPLNRAGNVLVPGRYTYAGELEKRAEQVAASSADSSLLFGEASRFAQAGADSLAAYGLKPLTVKSVQSGIAKLKLNPSDAGNDLLEASLNNVSEDIAKWVNKEGVISADALYAIRRNSVDAAIRKMMPGSDEVVQKSRAAGVMAKLHPLIDDAIETAGGSGYKKYLSDYTAGRHKIEQTKMGAFAADLFRTKPTAFVELVEGNSPKEVEKIFGHGKYDIAKEMPPESMGQLRSIANLVKRSAESAERAGYGHNALAEIMKTHTPAWRIPWGLSPKTMAMNQALAVAQKRLSSKTMNILAEGMKSGAKADELMSFLPAKERVNLLRVLSDPSTYRGVGAGMMPTQEQE